MTCRAVAKVAGGAAILGILAGLPGVSIAATEPKTFRLRPGPASETKSFAIAELGVAVWVTGRKAAPGDKEVAFLTDHGILRNLSDRYAVGPVLHCEAGSHRSRLGPAIRVRRWLEGTSALDVQAGALLVGGQSSGVDFRGPAPFVQASFSAGDVIVFHAGAQAHAVRLRGDYPHVSGLPPTGVDEDVKDVVTHFGAKLGTVPGRVGTVVVLVVGGLAVLALSGIED